MKLLMILKKLTLLESFRSFNSKDPVKAFITRLKCWKDYQVGLRSLELDYFRVSWSIIIFLGMPDLKQKNWIAWETRPQWKFLLGLTKKSDPWCPSSVLIKVIEVRVNRYEVGWSEGDISVIELIWSKWNKWQ